MIVQGGYTFENILAHGKRASQRALVRIGAFIRACARRNLKNRKHKISKPGNPPFVHGSTFKASVLFDVDPVKNTLYVGPMALATRRLNSQGQGIPEILEYGGRAAKGTAGNWFDKKAPFMTNFGQIVNFFRRRGRGPLTWGKTRQEVQSKIDEARNRRAGHEIQPRKGGKRSQYVNYKRYSPLKQKKVYLQNIAIESEKAATEVAKTVVELFGYPNSTNLKPISPRPLMAYTMAQPNVEQTIKSIMKQEMENYSK